MDVRDFLEVPARWRWGGVDGEDCTTWCARYAELLTGEDPAMKFRGSYSTRDGSDALIAAHGGLVPLIGPLLASQGWRRVQQPQPGDMAVIMAMAGFDGEAPLLKAVSALRFGPLWSVFGPRGPVGIAASRAQLVACWRWCA